MPLPNLRTWGSGENVTANMMNAYVSNVVRFFVQRPGAVMARNSNQSIPNNSYTLVQWNRNVAGDFVDDMWTNGSPGDITARTPGIFDVRAQVAFAASPNGIRAISLDVIRKPGSAWGSTTPSFARSGAASSYADPPSYVFPYNDFTVHADTTIVQCGRFLPLDEGDSIRMYVYQNSGGSLNALGSSSHIYTYLSVRWIAKDR